MDKPWKVVFAFLGVFIAGAVFGGLLALRVDRTVSERRLQEQAAQAAQVAALAAKTPPAPAQSQPAPQLQPQPQPRPPAPAQPVPEAVQTAQLMRRVTNQLNLTATQKAQVAPIIQRAVQDFWRESQNYNRENLFLTQRLKADIAKELTPEQQTRLDELWLRGLETFRKRQNEAQAQARAQGPQVPPGLAKPAEATPATKIPASVELKPADPAAQSKPPGGDDN